MSSNYPRGSRWRKWDLHVHSPKVFLNNHFGTASIDDFVNKICECEIVAVGLTNYFRFDDTELGEIKDKLTKKGIVVFPNLEFRTQPRNKDNEEMHIHVLFSNNVPARKITNFLGRLETVDNKYCKDLTKEEIKTTSITIGELRNKLAGDKEIKHLEDYLIIACPRGQGNFRPSNKDDGRGNNFAIVVDENSDILFGNADDTKFFLKEDRYKNAKEKPVLLCSDTHEMDSIGTKFSWVKSDTTFEGLKQILYEPLERVKIQKENPSFEYNKPFFAGIDIKDKVAIFTQDKDQVYFCKKTLPLNKNLVAIIGGRGTGKSMLVDYWANIFRNHNSDYLKDSNFNIEYAKDNIPEPTTETYDGGGDNYLDFIYIPQSQLKEISKKEKIEQEVKKLLDLEDLYFSQDLNDEIQSVLEGINRLQDWFIEEDEEGRQLNQKKYVETLRTKSEELLKSITTKNNKEKLEKYTKNIGAIQEIINNLEYLNKLKQQLEQVQKSLNEEIIEINKKLPQNDDYKEIKQVDFKIQLDSIAESRRNLETQEKIKEGENGEIKKDFEEEGFTGDLASLLKNAGAYQSQIKWADKQLATIVKKKTELEKAQRKRDDLASKFKTEYESQKEKIDLAWKSTLEKHKGAHKELIERILLKEGKTSIEGEIIFDNEVFFDKILNIVDKRTYRDIATLKKRIKVSNFEDWIKFVNDNLKDIVDGEEAEKFEGIENIIFGIKERGEYLRTLPKITYDGRKLNRLSVGQRGTVYLCLKLATDAFSKPIIFDQPEDDLDNKFIVSELIDIFRELKKYRQIIIVTHNANLVVNADAEQVIIANNTDEKLTYKSGSLEDIKIIEGVCEILEGGEEAFEKRKHRYHLN